LLSGPCAICKDPRWRLEYTNAQYMAQPEDSCALGSRNAVWRLPVLKPAIFLTWFVAACPLFLVLLGMVINRAGGLPTSRHY